MVRSFKAFLLFCLFIFLLTGCKDLKEVDRITFPVVLGMDWDETNNNIKIYAQVTTLSTQSGGQSQSASSFSVLEGEGITLKEAMDNLIDHAQQYISWKQIIAVVLTDKMAKHGISKELDLLSRNEQIHLNSYLLITTENLRELLGTAPLLESGLPTTIVGVDLISEQSTHSKAVTMKDFIVATLNKEIEPVLPLIMIHHKEENKKETKIEFDYKGLGVFHDDQLVGWLDEKGTGALLFASGIQNQGSFTLFQSQETGTEEITVSELTTKAKLIPYMQGNQLGITLKISVVYDIYSYVATKKIDVKEAEDVNSLVGAYIKKEVDTLVDKAQHEFDADILGFGGKIYRKYPKYWLENKDNWRKIFSDMDVQVEVEASLRDTGELTNSFKYQNGKD